MTRAYRASLSFVALYKEFTREEIMAKERNLTQAGNLRYQPECTKKVLGYDNLVLPMIDVEWAVLEVFVEVGIIPVQHAPLLTRSLKGHLKDFITTTMIDKREREETGHDIAALCAVIGERVPPELRPYVHQFLTSMDTRDTAAALLYMRAHAALKPLVRDTVKHLGEKIHAHRDDVKIGRSHLQHALPITFGFEFTPTLERIMKGALAMDETAKKLVGKMTGAVGASNPHIAYKLNERCGNISFQRRVLSKLGVQSEVFSTQNVLPEALADYLFACVNLSGALGQFGRDCRILMSTEIAEVYEEFGVGQVGSSRMPHKRNPKTFEQLEGMYCRAKAEYAKVFDTTISSLSRDLVGSCIARDFPMIIIILATQLETLLEQRDGKTFIERIGFNTTRAMDRVRESGRVVLSEPLHTALALAGFSKDAHRFVSHEIVPLLRAGLTPYQALEASAALTGDREAMDLFKEFPKDLQEMFKSGCALNYTGTAVTDAGIVAARAAGFLASYK